MRMNERQRKPGYEVPQFIDMQIDIVEFNS